MSEPKSFPSGASFLEIVQEFERRSDLTAERLDELGNKAPRCYDALGKALALLDFAACCGWGCNAGDHRAEFLVGRAVSSSFATMRLLKGGYYDEGLSLVRTVGEIANLMMLFMVDRAALDRWKSADEADRQRLFRPVKVRLALQAADAPIPITEERFRALSGFSIHTGPDSLPQAHNPIGQAMTAPRYQEAGAVIVLNELAIAVGFVAITTPSVLGLEHEPRTWLIDAGKDLRDTFGAVLVTVKGRPWFKLN